MKAYKIDLSIYKGIVREVISEAVQRKAFDLGYEWSIKGRCVHCKEVPYIFLNEDNDITWVGEKDRDYYLAHKNTAISTADFLALTTAKDEPTFKPFDKVLVRDHDDREWMPDFYAKLSGNIRVAMSGEWKQCIPYEGNEHLLGTTDAVK